MYASSYRAFASRRSCSVEAALLTTSLANFIWFAVARNSERQRPNASSKRRSAEFMALANHVSVYQGAACRERSGVSVERMHCARTLASLTARGGSDLLGDLVVQGQRVRLFPVEHVTHGGAEQDAGFREPDGLKVAADQVLVREINVRGIDGASHHARRVGEEVLVMRRLRGAVGDDQRGLAAAPGPPAALGVIRGRGRHVAHVDCVQRRDVDAELHGR